MRQSFNLLNEWTIELEILKSNPENQIQQSRGEKFSGNWGNINIIVVDNIS